MRNFHDLLAQLAEESKVKKGILRTRYELPDELNFYIPRLKKLVPESTLVSEAVWEQVEENLTRFISPAENDWVADVLGIVTATAALVLAAAKS